MPTNDFYNHGSVPQNGTPGDAPEIFAEFESVMAGFAKLPTMTGNGGKVVKVNAGGTALETQAADAMVAATIHAATSKATPVDADELGIVDSAASNGLKKLTWENLKATMYAAFGALVAAGTGKTTPVDADSIAMSDSAASDATKTLTFANLWAWIQSKLASPGPIGGTTPAAGKFTTLETTGNAGLGVAPLANIGLRANALLSGSANQYGIVSGPTINSAATLTGHGVYSLPSTEAAAFTCSNLISIRAAGFTKGAGSTVTNYYAFYGDAETDATNNYGLYAGDSSAFGVVPVAVNKLTAQSDTSDNTTYSFVARNSSTTGLFYAQSNGAIGTGTAAASPYNNTTASAANVFVTSGGILQRSTSSLRFKTGVEDMQQQYAEALVYQSRPVFYRSTCEADNPLHSYWGFIAEELALIDPRVVQWGKPTHTVVKDVERERFVRDADGNKTYEWHDEQVPARDAHGIIAIDGVVQMQTIKVRGLPIKETYIEQVEVTETNQDAELIPDGVAYERFVVALVKVAQEQKARIDALEARLAAAGIA